MLCTKRLISYKVFIFTRLFNGPFRPREIKTRLFMNWEQIQLQLVFADLPADHSGW